MRVSVDSTRPKRRFQIPVVTVRPAVDDGGRSRFGLGALPILQFKELEVDHERYEAWKASLRESPVHKSD